MPAQELYNTTLFNDANLTHYYRLEANGSDSKGSYTFTPVNSPTFGSGKFNNDVALVSASSQSLKNESSAIFSGSGDFTILFWLKMTTNSQYVFYSGNTGNVACIHVNVNGTGKMEFDKSGGTLLTSSSAVNDGSYHMVALTRTSNVFQWYIDGAADGGTATDSISFGTDFSYIGCFNVGTVGSPTYGGFLNGHVDDFAIFSRALSSSEISNLFNGTLPSRFGGLLLGSEI